MSPEERQAIRERVNKATPGPWEYRGRDSVGSTSRNVLVAVCSQPNESDNGSFIAHAREDVPKLLDENERLENENTYHSLQLDRAREEIERLRGELQSTQHTLNSYVHEYNIC